MKITGIRAYRVDLALHEGSYRWSGGNSVSVFDSTVVAVETDAGLTGYGEICPLGPAYLPAYARGARTGIAEIAPALLGADPLELGVLNRRMDAALRGHPYVKSAIDVACWDILGRRSGLPVATLLGGHVGDDVALYRAISQEAPGQMAARVAEYRAEGYRKFQLKVGGDPDTDIERIRAVAAVLQRGDVLVADANTGLDPARGRSRRRCRPGRRRLHRAAVPDLRGVPGRAACDAPAVHPGRGDRRHFDGGSRCRATVPWTSST